MVKICVRVSRFGAVVFLITASGSDCPSFTPYADWTCDQSVGLTPPERSHSPLPENVISPDWTAFLEFGYVAWKAVHANDGHASDEPRDLAVFTVHSQLLLAIQTALANPRGVLLLMFLVFWDRPPSLLYCGE